MQVSNKKLETDFDTNFVILLSDSFAARNIV